MTSRLSLLGVEGHALISEVGEEDIAYDFKADYCYKINMPDEFQVVGGTSGMFEFLNLPPSINSFGGQGSLFQIPTHIYSLCNPTRPLVGTDKDQTGRQVEMLTQTRMFSAGNVSCACL